MANELVYKGPSPGQKPADAVDEEWDLPPELMGFGPRSKGSDPVHAPGVRAAARDAAQDAGQARREGDPEFASARESDAVELTQTRWDWGDTRTWLWFAAMFFGFLLLVALCYFLPEGRHASPPPIRVY